jgi:hypothetical protein
VRWVTGQPILERIPSAILRQGDAAVAGYADLRALTHCSSKDAVDYVLAHNSRPDLVRVTIDERARVNLDFPPDGPIGTSNIVIAARGPDGRTTPSEFAITVQPPGTGNLARYHHVRAQGSSREVRASSADARHVIDGNSDTRWSSDYQDPAWIAVDLGSIHTVARVRLSWEGAYGRRYEIQTSSDGTTWKTVQTENAGDGGMDEVAFAPVEARHVRLFGHQRATTWGYSLYEFEIYGPDADRDAAR